MKTKILITAVQLQDKIDDFQELIADYNLEVHMPPVVQQLNEFDLLEIIDPFVGVIAGDDHFTRKVLEQGKNLKVISRWGIGTDGIDHTACDELGIKIVNTPNVFTDEVADVTFGYLVCLARGLHLLDQGVRDKQWPKIRGISLRDKTLGIIGMGNIGQGVALRALASGMRVLAYDVSAIPNKFVSETGVTVSELDNLLKESQFISLNCNLTSSNRHILSTPAFQRMSNGVYIINTARGPLIDQDALIDALETGKVAGAALDVFETEPLEEFSQLRNFHNCIFGTHNSSNTTEAVLRVNELAFQNLIDAI